ncbi:MAG: domain S-box protein, partial [Daejeonella sp.]|nr:domain S-box protein [Daejeonella sp.]
MSTSNRSLLDQLRIEAEKMLTGSAKKNASNLSERQIKELLHELQVQQIELEMQNDELRISNNIIEEQSHKFAGLYALAPVGYLLLNNFGFIEEINDTGLKMLDIGKRLAINRRFQSFIRPEDNDQFHIFLQRVLSRKTRQSCQLTIITPKGNQFYVQIEGIAIDNNNEFKVTSQCYIALIDITERKKAQIIQQETSQRLEMALSASLTGTWEIDIQGNKISLDKFCYNIFELNPDEFDGSTDTFCSFIHPEDRDWVVKKLQASYNPKTELDIEHRILLKKNKIKYVAARGHVIEHQQKACFVGIITDITERKQLELEAQQLKDNQQLVINEAALQGQENERERISSALHDSVSQLLYGIKLKVEQEKEACKMFVDL